MVAYGMTPVAAVKSATSTAAKVLRLLCEEVRGALAVSNPRIEIITAENLA